MLPSHKLFGARQTKSTPPTPPLHPLLNEGYLLPSSITDTTLGWMRGAPYSWPHSTDIGHCTLYCREPSADPSCWPLVRNITSIFIMPQHYCWMTFRIFSSRCLATTLCICTFRPIIKSVCLEFCNLPHFRHTDLKLICLCLTLTSHKQTTGWGTL